MYILAALGNPGPEYRRHRHNVGFMVGKTLHERWGWPSLRTGFSGLYQQGIVGNERVLLLFPMTYMNRSGTAVAEAARYFDVPVSDVLAIHDEVEIPFGDVRLKEEGGLGGHNGLRSLERALASRSFWRVRVGVGRPPLARISVADHVLSPFTEPEEEVELLLERAADSASDWIEGHEQ